MRQVTCPYCGKLAEYINSKYYYSNGVDYGMIYICRPCDAIVGVHRGTDQPLGTLAKKDLRDLRKKCHAGFDPMWKKGPGRRAVRRGKAYKWLAGAMGMSPIAAHISKFREGDCMKLLQLLEGP